MSTSQDLEVKLNINLLYRVTLTGVSDKENKPTANPLSHPVTKPISCAQMGLTWTIKVTSTTHWAGCGESVVPSGCQDGGVGDLSSLEAVSRAEPHLWEGAPDTACLLMGLWSCHPTGDLQGRTLPSTVMVLCHPSVHVGQEQAHASMEQMSLR